jgi:serine/threonine protein kinase
MLIKMVVTSWCLLRLQVRLICKYCDKGSLREALDLGAFKLPDGVPGLPSLLIHLLLLLLPRTQHLQVRLICEYCDKGSLREALDLGAFKLPDGGVNYPAVLDTAVELVTAVLHMHQRNVLHSDLKVGGDWCSAESRAAGPVLLLNLVAGTELVTAVGGVEVHEVSASSHTHPP